MSRSPATMNRAAVASLAEERVDWRHKAIPPALWGKTIEEIRGQQPGLSQFPTPLLTVSRHALEHNRDSLARWCAERGLDLAPHGKATMAPQLWQQQLAAGAWAITVANQAQLAVARAFGVSRIMVANAVTSPVTLRWIADELAREPELEILVWADAVRTVELMAETLAAHAAGTVPQNRLGVLVERGGAGGRTGTRDPATSLDVANAVAASPHLRLAGVAGYEGALAHASDERSREVVRSYLRDLVGDHHRLDSAGYYDGLVTPVGSAGGSAYFDVVAEELAGLAGSGTRVVLRSGAYLVHDDGFYRYISPLGSEPRTSGPGLVAAMHGWVRVSSQPEPGMALVDAGKRDLPFDEGLPEVQRLRPRTRQDRAATLSGVEVTALNDQHAFLAFDRGAEAPV